jgi:hydrogenase maturation protein HypF
VAVGEPEPAGKDALVRLRQRKRRDAKPFAVMARDLDSAKKYCRVSPAEGHLLTSREAPIVVMEARDDNGLPAEIIHPGLKTLGVMLPYTPLHYLLFEEGLDLLVMTSANISDEPLITSNEEALSQLAEIADYLLVHNRDIYNPCDDSVLTVSAAGLPHFFRRARGFVPAAISIPSSTAPILAVGSEMKNTFCLTRASEAYLSQHWGDLNHYHNYENFLHGIERFKQMLDVEPAVIAHDLHPEYQATRWAKSQKNVTLEGIQHHHAHMAAVMAENSLQGDVLGLICDGTGWGPDGAVWGCEILQGNYLDYTRLAHLKYIPLVGGDLCSKRPYRMAFLYLLAALGETA